MKFDRSTVFACVLAIMFWSWATGTGGNDHSPGPGPRPLDDRPVLKWVARVARTLLWVSLVTEPPPSDRVYTASVMVDADGVPMLDHGRGW